MITIQTVCFQPWKLAHGYHTFCANLMPSSVSNVITTMILKEIDIEMRKELSKLREYLRSQKIITN
jgi:hypothetical protein